MADTKFVIDGADYEVPMLASLNMAEALLFYKYAEVSPLEVEDVTPGVLAALIHIAIQRAKPDLREKQVRAMIAEMNMLELFMQMADAIKTKQDEEEGEERPPESPTPPGAEPAPADVGEQTASQTATENGSNGSSGRSPVLSDPSPTGTPV